MFLFKFKYRHLFYYELCLFIYLFIYILKKNYFLLNYKIFFALDIKK